MLTQLNCNFVKGRQFLWNSLLCLLQPLDRTWFGSTFYLESECKHSSHPGSQTTAASSDALASAQSQSEPEGWVPGASTDHLSPCWHPRGLNDAAFYGNPFFSLPFCNTHLHINISRGIYSILPYGQQLLFLPGCHLFGCYFFDFIFKQWSMEYSNTERGTDGEQIQITDFQSHPNISNWAGWGNTTSLSACSMQTNINKSQSKRGKRQQIRKWHT